MKALATAALAAIVLTISTGALAGNPPRPQSGPAKPSSFAPHDTGRRVFGAPIQPPIVGARKAPRHKASEATKRPHATTPTKSAVTKKAKKHTGVKTPKPAEAATG